MLLDISKDTEVPASLDACWRLVSDVPRLSACIPGVTDVREIEPGREYSATVSDKLGPFRLQLPATITIQEMDEPRKLSAELRGNDGRGQARVQGSLQATLEPTGEGTRFSISVHMEVLGKLAALGATPMRRRTDEIFAQFIERVRQELS
ncbi:MAG TPA: SRPBCC domain-containing protein [Chloroflexota bacterium]|nr:SRPBCC domain-containing protein [Chloroflexota bacterium]